jgi:hypothetical protein
MQQLKPNEKIVRIGHRNGSNKGILTIASEVSGVLVYYGISFASPKDVYDKQLGIEMARVRLAQFKDELFNNNVYAGSAVVNNVTHLSVVQAILCDVIARNALPDWALPVVLAHLQYIIGKQLA